MPTGCIFNRASSSKQQNSVDGFKIQKNQQSKQDFLSVFLIRITLSENGFLEMKMNGDNQASVLCLSYSEVSDYAAKFWILESAGCVFFNRGFDNILLFRFNSVRHRNFIS